MLQPNSEKILKVLDLPENEGGQTESTDEELSVTASTIDPKSSDPESSDPKSAKKKGMAKGKASSNRSAQS